MNLDNLRAQVQTVKNRGKGNPYEFKTQKGKNIVRILPYALDRDNPFVCVYTRYLNGKTHIGLKSYGKTDPIDEYASLLWATGKPEEQAFAKKLFSKKSWMCLVIDRSEGDKATPKWLRLSDTQFVEITTAILGDEEMEEQAKGDITDIKNGYDVILTKLTPEETKTEYGKIKVKVKSTSSPLHTNKEIVKGWLKNQPALEQVFSKLSYSELEEELRLFLNPKEERDDKTVKYGKTLNDSKSSYNDEDDDDVPFKGKQTKSTNHVDDDDDDDLYPPQKSTNKNKNIDDDEDNVPVKKSSDKSVDELDDLLRDV